MPGSGESNKVLLDQRNFGFNGIRHTAQEMKNISLDDPRTFSENGLESNEVIRQEYCGNNCVVSTGFVAGDAKPACDTTYLRLEKDGVEPTTLLLRPDEMRALAWVAVASGAVWSHLMAQKEPD